MTPNTKMSKRQTKRVSYEQRQILLSFMVGHEDLARSRITGPGAARQRQKLIQELANKLNSVTTGSFKTPDKWLKCWQDWKCDTRHKLAKFKEGRQAGLSGGGSFNPLEKELIQFYGLGDKEDLPGNEDPLQELSSFKLMSEAACATTTPPIDMEMDEEIVEEESSMHSHESKIRANDSLHAAVERQTVAIENVGAGLHDIAAALRQIAAALQTLKPKGQS